MYKLKKKPDLERLRRSGLFGPTFCDEVEKELAELLEAFAPPETELQDYSLENDGYLVVLDIGDNPHSLPKANLSDGFINSFPGPEWIETAKLVDGIEIVRIMYLYDNDYAMIFVFDRRLWQDDAEFQAFLTEQLAYQQVFENKAEGGDIPW